MEESIDPFHSRKFALFHGKFTVEKHKGVRTECNAVFKLLDDVKSEIVDRSPSLDKFLIDTGKRLRSLWGTLFK